MGRNMKRFIVLSITILALFFMFSILLFSCSPSSKQITASDNSEIAKLMEQIELKDQEIADLKSELEATKKDLESVSKALNQKLEEETTITTTTEVITQEEFRISDEIIRTNNSGESISLVVHSIENIKKYGKYEEPSEGMRWVAFDVEVANNTSEVMSYNPYNYVLRDADSYSYDDMAFGGKEPRLSSGDLATGSRTRGWVTIEVPKDITIIEILATPLYTNPPVVIKLVPQLDPSL